MILEQIKSPKDIKRFSIPELTQLCSEIRQRILAVVSTNGGHLASSLGAVELIVALHYCLNCPEDKIIFDVGHQAYAHKILTARNNRFDTLRQFGGISGFPLREESEYDVVSSGHSSDAVSMALGFVCAQLYLPQQQKFRVVAVIGDGSLSGGLCFEGLNNAGHLKNDLLVILNTNELSISPNVGALSTYLNKIISLPIYNRFRQSLEEFLSSRVRGGKRLLRLANKFEEGLKGLFVPGILFEELGFRYFGPFDGHNLATLISALKNIINLRGPRIMHVVTKKGKGYLPAEENPVCFHSTPPFDIATGKTFIQQQTPTTYTQIFSETLVDLARNNKNILAITAAMPEGTGLDKFANHFPERFFDVGIAEQHACCFAGALALNGFRPVVAVYSSFLQRAFDQIIENVCLQKAPVLFAIDRAGLVGEDGVTHQGIFDIAFLRMIPNIVIMAPKDGQELKQMLEFALTLDLPSAIRYPKAVIPKPIREQSETLELGRPEVLIEGSDVALFALGSMVEVSLRVFELLRKDGISTMVVNSRFVKPLDAEFFNKIAESVKLVVTIEEGVVDGGFGSALSELINRPLLRFGLPNQFITHGKRNVLLECYGLSAGSIASAIKRRLYGKDAY
ncbi:MAG: 1-deoxy-D-xylulose-5-phosphate synthase [Candidatus Omnitrophica bacterium]|nr:1-deoxy-D-xylulose-5-phosphate synthase [Candidatus Omnitrophota bacterium]